MTLSICEFDREAMSHTGRQGTTTQVIIQGRIVP